MSAAATTPTADAPALVEPSDAGIDGAALRRLDDRIAGAIAAGTCDGAVYLLARGGRVVRHRAVGLSDLRAGRAARLDDVFATMSLSKAFCAAAVLRLVDHGRLELETRVCEVIPEFAVRGKQRVTVRHLLTHTAGTWAGFGPPPGLSAADNFDLERATAAVCALPIDNRPGERVVYNPWASYGLLGEIVRRLDSAARPFRQIMLEDVFEPLGMLDSSYGLAVDHPRRVPLVQREQTAVVTEQEVLHGLNRLIDEHAELPAGGSFATTADVHRFAEMLRGRGTLGDVRLLSPAIVDYAYANHTGDRPNHFWDFDTEARRIDDFVPNFSLGGGYVRGRGHGLTPLGLTASPSAFGAVGGGSTLFMVDPPRELVLVFQSAGLLSGLGHFRRLQQLSDLALASVAG